MNENNAWLKTTDRNRNALHRSVFILIAVLLFFLSFQQLAAQITVSPTRLFFNNTAEQTDSKTINISNGAKDSISFVVAINDWYRDSLGNKVYVAGGTLPVSNAAWMKVYPASVTLAPGETKEITVTQQIPAGEIKPVTNSMLFLTQVNEQKPQALPHPAKDRQVSVIIKLQFGIHLYNELPGLSKKDLVFSSFEDRGNVNDSTRLLAVKIFNNGELSTDGRLSFSLTNKTTGEELKQPPVTIGMLPGAAQVVYIHIPAHRAKGDYLAEAVLDSGNNNDLKVARKNIRYE